MYLTGKFGIADMAFVYFLLNDFSDIDVFEFRFHRFVSCLLTICSPDVWRFLLYKKREELYCSLKTWYRQTPDLQMNRINTSRWCYMYATHTAARVHTTNGSIILFHPCRSKFWRFSFLDEAYNAFFLLYNVYISLLWIVIYPLRRCKDTKKVEQCDAVEVFIHTKDMKIM